LFSRETLFRRIGPVVGLTLLVLLYTAPPRSGAQGSGPTIPAALVAALAAMATVLLPWDRLPSSARFVPAFAYLLVVSLARDAPGDAGATYSQVVMIPLVWLALFGGPREVAGGVLVAGGALFAPIVGGRTSPGDVHHAVLIFGGSVMVGITIQMFFAQLRSHTSGLYALANTDPLTGAANRRGWDEEFRQALASRRKASWRSRSSCSTWITSRTTTTGTATRKVIVF
jgi:hypothetical protein